MIYTQAAKDAIEEKETLQETILEAAEERKEAFTYLKEVRDSLTYYDKEIDRMEERMDELDDIIKNGIH